ncbi:DUF1740-domain-containing protein [Plenodomus tracheiphilus IPT5]|uniref:DUF1740-domain-containing protein n=1 Tax=Plenodomus tracheiphilus IPT5 TaxID=1408161 RepID=A0A6A7AT08_9PLEO|nr:DUF1740-domain-containing protein [Plenodomus tracheiphilus IPT5]
MAANIPKFASFRPKPKPAPEPSEEPASKSKGSHDTKLTGREKKASRVRGPSPPPPPQSHSHHDTSSSKIYFSDRRGDANLLRYGTLDRYDIPAYRRYGHGFVLGLPLDQKIDREQSTDTALCIASSRKRQERLLTNKRLNKSTHRALRLIKHSQARHTGDFDQDFISITTTRGSAQHSSEPEDGEPPPLDYRDIQGRPKSDEPLDPDTHYEPDADVVIDTEVTKKNSRLARQTKEHPEHAEHWFALIEHQEAMLKLERPSNELTASDKAHLAQVRISIYEEALKKTKMNQQGQGKLWEGLLAEARKVWDDIRLASKWNQVLAEHPQNTNLWWLYLDSVQSSFARFRFDDCRSAYLSCVSALQSSTTPIPSETYLRLLVRLTSMTYDCGYQELALAIWQAVLEFNLMRPNAEEGTTFLSLFEEFWESEASRIGEPEAKGWKNSRGAVDHQPSGPSPLLENDSTTNSLSDFYRRELDAMTKLQYPGRMTDEVGEDDAFHAVLFSDIEAYLNIIPLETSSTLIVDAFICFCRLPPLPQLAPHQKEWWSDPFLRLQTEGGTQSGIKVVPGVQTLDRFSNLPVQSFQATTELLFQNGSTLRGDRLQPDFPRRLLKLVATAYPDHDIIGEYLLAFEHRHFPSEAPKTAKQLLKVCPSSLRLYNAYGLVELGRSDMDRANKVFSMALTMHKGGIVLWTYENIKLYHNWIWEALHRGAQNHALWRTISPDGKIPIPASQDSRPTHDALLQIRLLLSERSERALLNHEFETAILSTSMQALIVYFINGAKAESALEVHQSLSAWMTSHKLSNSMYAELHAQYMADFLAYHAMHAAIVKPALIRTALEPLIARFPNNTILLSLYAANEARFAIDDRVRGILQRHDLQGAEETSVAGWLFAIHYELQKGDIAGSTSHSVRALFHRATAAIGQHCPALWISYLRFELTQFREEQARSLKRTKKEDGKDYHTNRVRAAKQRIRESFQHGLTELPWCKEFVMLPFSPEFDGAFEDVEKSKFYRVMQEKEIRLYIDLDQTGI